MTVLSSSQNQKRLNESNTLFHQGLYEEALDGFKSVLKSTEDLLMYANIGYCYQKLEKYELAYHAFQSFVTLWPFKTHAWKAMAYCSYEREAYQDMERCALMAIKWDRDLKKDDDEYAWQQLTIAQFLLNKPKSALNSAWHTLALNPRNSYVKYYEACSLCHENTLDLEEAKIALLDAVSLEPSLWQEAHEEGHVDAILEDELFQDLPKWFEVVQTILDDDLPALRLQLSTYPEIPTQGKWTLYDFAYKHQRRWAKHFLITHYHLEFSLQEEQEEEENQEEQEDQKGQEE